MSPATRKPIRRVAVYARLSVTTEESVSIARQFEAARAYARARGWTIALEATDDGVSATKNKPEDRPGWRSIIDSPERYEAVIVWKIDRLARRVLDFLHADETLQDRGAGIVAVEDPVDMTTAQGRAFATMLAVFGEMEAAAISARVAAARRALVADGRRVGGRPPFGFMNIPNPEGPGMVLAHDPETIDYVREAARRALTGASVYSIARWLESEGVKPRARRRRRDGIVEDVPTQSRFWHDASVETFLRAPALAGMTPYTPGRKPGEEVTVDVLRDADGLPVIDETVAIMEPREWREMLAKIDAAKRPGSRPRGDEVALLYGLARCGGCDGLLHRATTGSGNRKYTSYRCQNRECEARASAARPALERYVLETITAKWGHLPVIETMATIPDQRESLAEVEAAITDTLARLAEVDDDPDLEDALTDRLRSLKAARREARAAETTPTVETVETGETFTEAFARVADDAGRREVLQAALTSVTVAPAGRRGNRLDPSRVRLIGRDGRDVVTGEVLDVEALQADLLAGQTD